MKTKSALIIIDMQKDGMRMLPQALTVVEPVRKLLEAFRAAELPVIFKSRVHRANGVDVENFRRELFAAHPFLVAGTPGAEVIAELRPLPDEIQIRGTRFSGFFQTELQIVLTRLGVKRLYVCGVQTPNCVRATVTDAIAYDYDVVLVSDAVTAKTPEIHRANVEDMRNMGVPVLTAAEAVAEIRG